jgi:hypothetical protein
MYDACAKDCAALSLSVERDALVNEAVNSQVPPNRHREQR